jgi:hypothetical protein
MLGDIIKGVILTIIIGAITTAILTLLSGQLNVIQPYRYSGGVYLLIVVFIMVVVTAPMWMDR